MATAKPNDEHEPAPEVDHAEILRVLTAERFTVWKPPAASTDRVTARDHPRTKALGVSTSGLDVRGRVHDDSRNSEPRRIP
jgi:hypothetical protein